MIFDVYSILNIFTQMYGGNMDRRQRKTREAIFGAFCELLSEKSFEHITVGEIIERADVGRATFYSHFETKEYLLKELCEELFCHIFDSTDHNHAHKHIFKCDAPESVFLHLFEHLKNNDNQIRALLCTQNNALFLGYFKEGIVKVIERNDSILPTSHIIEVPRDFLINHISSTFIETVNWWTKNKMNQSPELINSYFMKVING